MGQYKGQGMRTYERILSDCRAKGIRVGCRPSKVAKGDWRGESSDRTSGGEASLMAEIEALRAALAAK